MRNIRDNILKIEDNDDDDKVVYNASSDGQDAHGGFSFEMLKSMLKLDSESSNSRSTSSLDDSKDDFQPELFGLLDNPGVLRFGCLDYPLTVTEESDDNTAPERIRVSYDDIPLDNHTAWYNLVDGVNDDKTVFSLEYISKCVNDE